MNRSLVVIDLQNDITKNYRDIIDNVNKAIAIANETGLIVVYTSSITILPKERERLRREQKAKRL